MEHPKLDTHRGWRADGPVAVTGCEALTLGLDRLADVCCQSRGDLPGQDLPSANPLLTVKTVDTHI